MPAYEALKIFQAVCKTELEFGLHQQQSPSTALW